MVQKKENKTPNISSQYIVVQLANEEYGISIVQVERLIQVPEITKVPNMPDFAEGVINLRGKIIPIIDLRKKFNLPEKEWDDKTRIVVVIIESQTVGLIADGVSEVITLDPDQIDEVPSAMSTISSVGTEYLKGIGKVGDRLIILMNMDKIITSEEKESLKNI
ncbi:MAG: chemotaxis protein CheW [Elusimicrobiota bacterium]